MCTSHKHVTEAVVGWSWENGQLHGKTVDGIARVTANLHRAQWSWGNFRLVAERMDDQVQLTLEKLAEGILQAGVRRSVVAETDISWMTQAATPLRALNSPSTKERLSVLVSEDEVPEASYFVVAQAVKFFENPRLLSRR